MVEQLEIILGLENNGLLRRKEFTVKTPGFIKITHPSFAKATYDISNFLMHYADPSKEYLLRQTSEIRSFLDSQTDSAPENRIIADMLDNTIILYNKLVSERLGE